MRNALVSFPVLALPYSTNHTTLDTDTCAMHDSCVLLQKHSDDTIRQIGYWSRALNDAERRYNTAQREYRAIVWYVLILHLYLAGTHFTIRPDHGSVKGILNLTDTTNSLA